MATPSSRSLPPGAAPSPRSPSPALASGSQAQHAAAAPSSSYSLPLAGRSVPPAAAPSSRSPPLAAGSQAQDAAVSDPESASSRSLPLAAAPSSSYSLPLAVPLAAGSQAQAHQSPMTWVILGRVLTNFVVEDEVAGAEAQAHAQHAAVDFSLPLAPPPRVTVVSAGRSAHPNPNNPDGCPYIISAAPYCILAHFAEAPVTSHLVALRKFHTAEGQTTATAERVGERSCYAPMMMNLASIVLSSDDSDYTIYELQVHKGDSSARLISIGSGRNNWDWKDIRCPLPAGDRVWVSHGAVADDHQKLFWFDLSWGVLSYDASITARDPELQFHLLPDDRDLGEATPGIHTHRSITVSRNQLRYVDIIPEGGSARVSMWTWSRVSGEWQWESTYTMSFDDIWDDDSYKNTELPRNVPVLAVVCPSDPELVYFDLQHHLFGVNVPVHRIIQIEAYQPANMPWPPPPASSRYLISWVLPHGVSQEPVEPTYFPLSIELVGVIANFLQCPVARLFISMVCREWRAETLLLKPQPHYLPGLLLPHHKFRTLSLNETKTKRISSLICLTCCTAHPFRRPALSDGSRFIGSYEGGWVFTAHGQDRYHALINMHTGGEPILLPDKMKIFGWLQLHIILRAATLSAPPDMHGCIGAAIVSTSWSGHPNEHVVFWRMGSRVVSYAKELIADDILYMNGSFYILLRNGDVTVFTPEIEEYVSLNRLEVKTKDLHFNTVDDMDEVYLSRYLVEWQGALLMVVRRRRLVGPTSSQMICTYSFQVFRMAEVQKQENDQLQNNEYCWDRVVALDGFIIFLGRGCSRCYDAACFPGVQSGIFYHDEDFEKIDMIWNEKGQEYPCKDNGICRELPDRVEPLLTELIPSTYSCPIWFFH